MTIELLPDSKIEIAGAASAPADVGISLALLWRPVPETLPPDPTGGWFSPTVWIALRDGRVIPGQCLHKNAEVQFDAPVRAWFREDNGRSVQLGDDEVVIAWMPFAVPDHPHAVNGRMLIVNSTSPSNK